MTRSPPQHLTKFNCIIARIYKQQNSRWLLSGIELPMHFHTLSKLALVGSLLSTVNAGCFTSGASWSQVGGKPNAADVLVICVDRFSGYWFPYESRGYCSLTASANHVDYTISNLENRVANMDPNGCQTFLMDEINGCNQGGDSVYSFGWEFR